MVVSGYVASESVSHLEYMAWSVVVVVVGCRGCQWVVSWSKRVRRTVARLSDYIVVLRGGSAGDGQRRLTGVSQRRRATLTVRVIVFGGE